MSKASNMTGTLDPKQVEEADIAVEEDKHYYRNICDLYIDVFTKDIEEFYSFTKENFPSMFIDEFFHYENKINPDIMGNYMNILSNESRSDSIFETSVKKLFKNLGNQSLRIDCAEMFDDFLKKLPLSKGISDEIKEQLFYYSIHSLKYCGLLTDGYKKGLYLQKNFFLKSVWKKENRIVNRELDKNNLASLKI